MEEEKKQEDKDGDELDKKKGGREEEDREGQGGVSWVVTAQQEQVFMNAQVRGRDHRRACFCFVGEACSSEGKLECRALLIVRHAEFPVDLFETEKWININLYANGFSSWFIAARSCLCGLILSRS